MYTSYFGFTKQPFANSENQFFLTPAYEQAYTCLRQGVAKRRSLQLLTGISGTGKTTLLRRLIAGLKDEACCIFFWNAHLDFDELLSYLCDELGLRSRDAGRAQRLQALEVYLVAQLARGNQVVLVLDDAHDLADETLEALYHLARLETAGQRLLQIILSGQPALETRLTETPTLKSLSQQVDGHCRLEPLADNAVILYIQDQLREAGYEGTDLFEAKALRKVIAFSHGAPRLINLICNQALLLAYLNSEQRIPSRLVRKVAVDKPAHEQPAIAVSSTGPAATQSLPTPGHSFADTEEPELSAPHHAHDTQRFSLDLDIPMEAAARPHRHSRRRWPRMVLSLILLITLGTVLMVRHLDFPQGWELQQISQPLNHLARLIGIQNAPLDEPHLAQLTTLPDNAGHSPPAPAASASGVSTESMISGTLPEISLAPSGPSPTVTDPAVAERIEGLLAAAREQMAVLRYTVPAGANALDNYRQVLQLDPHNIEALRGIEQIKSSFVSWANSARARGDWSRAQRHLETALSIEPDDERVAQRLEQLRREMPPAQANR